MLAVLRVARRAAVAGPAAPFTTHAPNAPLDLDPSMHDMLAHLDMAPRLTAPAPAAVRVKDQPRELRILPDLPDPRPGPGPPDAGADADADDPVSANELRKSPAARFGSRRLGAVVLPRDLHDAVHRIIAPADKHALHNDAKRLFADSDTPHPRWDTAYDAHYKSRPQRNRHADRDSAAFVTVAMPAHFSVVYSVLDHLQHRLGPEWNVDNVLDWHSATGSALWASMLTFQRPQEPATPLAARLPMSTSTISTYTNIEKRDGLVQMSKRLLQEVDVGSTTITWQNAFHDSDKVARSEGGTTLALSAFALSGLSTPVARKELVKEMWQSGADVIVLIDHDTAEGFDSIATARQVLLDMGAKEFNDPSASDDPRRGCHVVAPCSHDKVCPLHVPGGSDERLACTFSQRLQRPDFLRRTKHAKAGHEDTGYAYVVVRRGPRPSAPESTVGRVGAVGMREQLKSGLSAGDVPELPLFTEQDLEAMRVAPGSAAETEAASATLLRPDVAELSEEELVTPLPPYGEMEPHLRAEAYHWPRLVLSPIKNSGHIIVDGCTPQGKIMRMIIPKSQGKQPYYDARKSSWGDLFPHPPKNAAQERFAPDSVDGSSSSRRRGKGKGRREVDVEMGERAGSKAQKKGKKTGKKVSLNAIAEDIKNVRRKRHLERRREQDRVAASHGHGDDQGLD